MEGDGRPSESGPSLDGASYGQGPVTHGSAISPDRFDSQLYSHGVQPGPQRPRRPKLQHSQSILRKQAEEEAIKRSRSLSESYELSADLQDKQVCVFVDCHTSTDNCGNCVSINLLDPFSRWRCWNANMVDVS